MRITTALTLLCAPAAPRLRAQRSLPLCLASFNSSSPTCRRKEVSIRPIETLAQTEQRSRRATAPTIDPEAATIERASMAEKRSCCASFLSCSPLRWRSVTRSLIHSLRALHALFLSARCCAAVVDVMQLPIADLQKLRQSLTEDVQTITQNYGNLKARDTRAQQARGEYRARSRSVLLQLLPEQSSKRRIADPRCALSISLLLLCPQLAHSKYGQALEALTDITPDNQDKRIMVPLTSSMYIPGKLSNIQSVLVDIGTGYFVEKPIADARVFITSKMDMISGNLAKVAGAMSGKRRDLDAVSSILQAKLQAQYQAQQQAMAKVDSLQ